jgi:hypothetical protein
MRPADSLLQLDQTDELTWRREGDEWDEAAEVGSPLPQDSMHWGPWVTPNAIF